MRVAAILLAPMLIAASPLAIRGLIFDGLPPVRFQHDATAQVAFVTNLDVYCGKPPSGLVWSGCYKGAIVYTLNPCQVSGDYAKHLCHELGHAEGWSRYHEF